MIDPYLNKPAPYINANQAKYGVGMVGRKPEPKVDEEIYHIVHQRILVNDPRLIKVVIAYNKGKNPDEVSNRMKDFHFIDMLKEAFK